MSCFSKKNKDSEFTSEPVKECCQKYGVGTGKTFRKKEPTNHYTSNYEYYRCTKCGHTWEVLMYND